MAICRCPVFYCLDFKAKTLYNIILNQGIPMNLNLNLILAPEQKEYLGVEPENHIYGFTAYLAEDVLVRELFLVQLPPGLSSNDLINQVVQEYQFDIFDVLSHASTKEIALGIVSYLRVDVSRLLTPHSSVASLYDKAIFLNFG